ncbi:autophagy-related protein 2 [Sporothrix curviconia]|uniref:Autophagy-related protein 2 n=1 Tax=Sporothrix curviconia TaxID=1260050 RepID=A0ABP0B9T0_9PEZI
MASILDSFRNSSMPKRLLRYALSRFDVLDADALNLDNLDLAWGRNTVLEFRDVGLKLKILQQLLQLPPTFHIRKAKVAILRITLPVDIYSSPIQIQVTGVDVRLRISKDGDEAGDKSGRRGSTKPGDDDDAVPTAADLAQSFLDHQPAQEKKALEEALAAADEEDEYDDDDDNDGDSTSSSSQTLGTGQALTLPAFLTGFLQGIVDRIQVNIEGVTFQLEVDVPVEASAATAAGPAAAETASPGGVEPVVFQLALSRMNVEGVTTSITPATSPKDQGGGGEDKDTAGDATRPPIAIVPKEGKRHISLENVRAFLISEANVFSTLDRSPSMPSMPSSLASRSPSIPSRGPPSRASTSSSGPTFTSRAFNNPVAASLHGQDGAEDDADGGAASIVASSVGRSAMLQSQYGLQDSEDAFNIPYEMDSSSDDNDSTTNENQPASFEGDDADAGVDADVDANDEANDDADADFDAGEALASSTSTPRASVYGGDHTSGLATNMSGMFPTQTSQAAQSAVVHGGSGDQERLQWSAWGHEAQSEPSLRRHADVPRPPIVGSTASSAGIDLLDTGAPLSGSQHSDSGGAASAGSAEPSDDLAESHMYSHEEAESMYMSAFSHPDPSRTRSAMPGGWDHEDGDDAGDHYDHYNDNRSVHSGSNRSGSIRADSPIPSAMFEDTYASNGGFNPDQSTQLPLRPASVEPAIQSSPPASPPLVRPAASLGLAGSGMLFQSASRRSSSSRGPSPANLNEIMDPSENVVFPGLRSSRRSSNEFPESSESPQNERDQQVAGYPEDEEQDSTRSQPDEAATPRGPARLVKEILALQYISIYVPSNHKPIDIAQQTAHELRLKQHQDRMGRSVAPHLPGAFSVYSSAGASSLGESSLGESAFYSRLDESQLLPQTAHEKPPPSDSSVEVTLAPLEIRFDASIGFLLAMVVSELMQSVKTGLQHKQKQRKRDPATAQGSDDTASPAVPEIKVHAEKISLLFLDKLAGVADTAERFFDLPRASGFSQTGDVLLQTILEDLVVGLIPSSSALPKPVLGSSRATTSVVSASKTTIDLKRFRFGYADADILSFDRRIQMRASVRDVFPPAGDDISVKISQSVQTFRCEINTLPLLVSMDLQRLDETFSWFGGLSSFLSMGSSITSAGSGGNGGAAKMVALPKAEVPAPMPRGVRFEAPINPDDKSAAAENKIDMRIGGIRLDLVGRDCSLGLDTSAVKLVSREEGIGVGVSRIKLAGPYLRNSRGDPPVTAEVVNTRLEFLNVPKDKDLERLLELITPSRVKFDEREDVIMVDTLLRQRRSGPLLRLNVDDLNVHVHNIAQLSCLPSLGEEIARLATVAKYLPEDDRPGLLTLGLIRRMDLSVDVGGRLGLFQATVGDFETAHISIPSLVSVAVGSLSLHRNHTEELIGSSAVPVVASPSTAAAVAAATAPSAASTVISPAQTSGKSPALMLRIIGDDMEPVIKIKMWGLNFEYRVPTIMDVLGLAKDATPQDFEASLAASVANLGEQAHTAIGRGSGSGASGSSGTSPRKKAASAADARDVAAKPTTLDLAFRDCMIGLNPLKLSSKLNVVLVDARLEVAIPKADEEIDTVVHLNKISLLLIDDVSTLSSAKEVSFAPQGAARRSSGGTSFLSPPTLSKDIVSRLCARGFVDICQISAAKVSIHVSAPGEDGQKTVDLEVRDDLLVLETCADSTQTLITLANALKPPTPPSKEIKFKTQVMPVRDLLASISIDAFGRAEGNYNFDEDFILEEDEDDGTMGPGSEENLYGASSGGSHLVLTDQGNRAVEESVASLPSIAADDDDLLLDDDLDADHGMAGTVAEQLFNASSVFSEQTERGGGSGGGSGGGKENVKPNDRRSLLLENSVSSLGAEENFFGTASDTAAEESSHANRWNSAQNNYDKNKKRKAGGGGGGGGIGEAIMPGGKPPPLCVRVRDVHVIWNLFDGYDWQNTRDVIAKTVEEVEAKAYERRTRHRRRSGQDQYNPYSDDEEEEAVIGDFLFNSIYIGIPATHDPRELTQAINQNIYGDATGDTESIAATTITAASTRAGGAGGGGGGGAGGHASRGSRSKKLKLQRSRRHKITFELGGVAADLVVYPPGSGETQSSIDVRVHDLDVFDHVPTSTWKKFATYDRDAGERPIDGDMLHLEVLVVKPVPELAATEFVLKVSLLPLRLHVDQDALDFITRFFEFKDDSAPPTHASASDVPFIQRAEIRDIPVQLDFKPKRVDYAGLRSGHTTEFMNFLILDGSRMTMRHTIIYGVSGFDRLGKTLNDIWMPDIKRHQLPGVLAGLAPVRSLVTVGSGFKDLIEIPIQEYRHNGRIVRSISKGAMAFAKSTGTELVKLGAKVATGTQYVLQGAEGMLNKNNPDAPQYLTAQTGGIGGIGGDSGDGDDSDDERKQISLYADQPTGVVQGLRHAYTSLARDLHVARDAIIAVPAEVRESTSATGAAKVVIKHAPTIIFRPAIGATKAIGQTLMGATNSLDPQNLRRVEDKYKSGPGRRG